MPSMEPSILNGLKVGVPQETMALAEPDHALEPHQVTQLTPWASHLCEQEHWLLHLMDV